MGLVRAVDYFRYATAMGAAAHPSDADDKKMPGGVTSVVFNKESGKPIYAAFCVALCFLVGETLFGRSVVQGESVKGHTL